MGPGVSAGRKNGPRSKFSLFFFIKFIWWSLGYFPKIFGEFEKKNIITIVPYGQNELQIISQNGGSYRTDRTAEILGNG